MNALKWPELSEHDVRNTVKVSTLDWYRCPSCMGQLKLFPEGREAAEVEAAGAFLRCTQCGSRYSVSNRIPRFVHDDQYASSFGFQWNKFRRTQLDSFTGLPLSSDRLFESTGWPRSMPDEVILEAGSGAGRFTEVLLKTGATVFSFDLSSAVDANFQNNGSHERLNLFQASIYDIPFQSEQFDRVMCLGVLQHTPDPDQSFKSLARLVKPGGHLAIDVYARRLQAVISWKHLLRPLTTKMSKEHLFLLVEKSVDLLLPAAIALRRFGGRWGARMFPILEYSHLGLPFELNKQWSVLDTFDMYSPAHDHPRSTSAVARWFVEAGFCDISVQYGANGVVGRGRKPPRLREN